MRAELLRLSEARGFGRTLFTDPACLASLPQVRSSLYERLIYEAPDWCRAVLVTVWPYSLYPRDSEMPEYYIASNASYAALSALADDIRALGIRAERISFPVKGLLWAAGAATVGKNGLVRLKDFGSAVVLGTLAIDADVAESYHDAPPACGDCTRCKEACPTGAIGAEELTPCKCLRAHMGAALHSDAVKGLMKTYLGCMECLRSCPFNHSRSSESPAALAAFDAARLIAGDDRDARALVGKNKTGGGKLTAEAIALHPTADLSAAEASAHPAVQDALRWAKEVRNARP